MLYFVAGILEENRFKKTDLKKLFFLKTDFLKKPIQNGKPIHEETIDSRIGLSESVAFGPSLVVTQLTIEHSPWTGIPTGSSKRSAESTISNILSYMRALKLRYLQQN